MFNTNSAEAITTFDRPTGAGWEVLPAGEGNLRVRLFGVWTLASGAHPVTGFDHFLRSGTRQISFDAHDLLAWDSVLVQFLCEIEGLAVVSRRDFFFVAPDWRHVTGTMMAALGGSRGFIGERR